MKYIVVHDLPVRSNYFIVIFKKKNKMPRIPRTDHRWNASISDELSVYKRTDGVES